VRAGWAAKAAFGALLLYGALRVVDPEARWAEARVPGDVVEHALLVYALLTCALAAFPRLSLTVGASAMLLLGLSVEVAQALPGVPGGFQLRDLTSDLVGVLLAAVPFLLGRAARVRAT
jgi:hypothetical protein